MDDEQEPQARASAEEVEPFLVRRVHCIRQQNRVVIGKRRLRLIERDSVLLSVPLIFGWLPLEAKFIHIQLYTYRTYDATLSMTT